MCGHNAMFVSNGMTDNTKATTRAKRLTLRPYVELRCHPPLSSNRFHGCSRGSGSGDRYIQKYAQAQDSSLFNENRANHCIVAYFFGVAILPRNPKNEGTQVRIVEVA
jgi:hypothetical protein